MILQRTYKGRVCYRQDKLNIWQLFRLLHKMIVEQGKDLKGVKYEITIT